MKLLDIETYGIRLYKTDDGYFFRYDDMLEPNVVHQVRYGTLEEALGDIISFILNPDNIYELEELDEYFQKAYELAGVPTDENPVHPEITETVGTFLYYVLEGMARANMKGE